jgi:tRNA threonylcarbamoyladenosine biosynthesis protein TsaE
LSPPQFCGGRGGHHSHRLAARDFFEFDLGRKTALFGAVEWSIKSVAEMEEFGAEWALGLEGGEVVALVGGLGAGKTHFTKGLVAAMGHEGEVTSPTFALVQEYRGGRLPVFHLDFYRLESAEELLGIGWDEMLDESGVIVAEWGDRFPEMLPEETRWLKFGIQPDGSRRVVEGG